MATKSASLRSAAIVHRELKRGVTSLATVVSIAPWLGLFGTLLGFASSFRSINGSKESIMAALFDSLSMAFMPCAFGLIVALITLWFYNYLLTEIEALDSDMDTAVLQLLNDLSRLQISN